MRIVLAGALVACAACAETPNPTATNAVFDPATTMVELDRSGGLEPTPGAGSTCVPGTQTYTYVIATAVLTWSACSAPTPDGVYNMVPGQATLTAAQADDLVGALGALQKPMQPCGSDVTEKYTFTTPHGATTYQNGVCLDGDDAVLNVIFTVAQ